MMRALITVLFGAIPATVLCALSFVLVGLRLDDSTKGTEVVLWNTDLFRAHLLATWWVLGVLGAVGAWIAAFSRTPLPEWKAALVASGLVFIAVLPIWFGWPHEYLNRSLSWNICLLWVFAAPPVVASTYIWQYCRVARAPRR
jgi:hypothetical protein